MDLSANPPLGMTMLSAAFPSFFPGPPNFRSFPRLAAALFLLLLFAPAGSSAGEGRVLKIMPLGDSITQGAAGRDNYRRHLWAMVGGSGVDFVGSMNRPYGALMPERGYDGDHEGHWGWQADELLEKAGEWAAASRPDIVLLHGGTNDLGRGESPGGTAAEVEGIIAALREVNPRVVVLVAMIIPVDHREMTGPITEFNGLVKEAAERLSTPRSPVVAVDHYSDFDPAVDTFDGIHPGGSGAGKMALRWSAALAPFLSGAAGEGRAGSGLDRSGGGALQGNKGEP